uniref:Uncharacterized protein n=1 Tax=Anguilla anguilla TaxID=7936 RepID=A0A0E9T2X8_ANGAN
MTLAEAREASSCLDALLGSFVTSWMSCCYALGKNVGRLATPREICRSFKCSPFGDNSCQVRFGGVPEV